MITKLLEQSTQSVLGNSNYIKDPHVRKAIPRFWHCTLSCPVSPNPVPDSSSGPLYMRIPSGRKFFSGFYPAWCGAETLLPHWSRTYCLRHAVLLSLPLTRLRFQIPPWSPLLLYQLQFLGLIPGPWPHSEPSAPPRPREVVVRNVYFSVLCNGDRPSFHIIMDHHSRRTKLQGPSEPITPFSPGSCSPTCKASCLGQKY